MKPSEIRDKSDSELSELEKELRDKLVRLRVSNVTSNNVNTAQFRQIRRDIARVLTVQTERSRKAAQ